MQIWLFWNQIGNILNILHLICVCMLYGLTRPLLPSIFAFMGEEWNNLLLLLGGFRTLWWCVVFVGLSVCLLHRYLLTFVYWALWHLGYRYEKTGSLPSRNSYFIEGQIPKEMIIIQCGRDVKRRLFQAREQYLWKVRQAPGLVDISCLLNVSEGLKEWHPNELSHKKKICHLSQVSLVRYPIPEFRFLVHNLGSHALWVWFFGKNS